MRFLVVLAGFVLLATVLLDSFQTVILPRRPVGRLRMTRLFYMLTWRPWHALGRHIRGRAVREQFFSTYGPLSLLVLFVMWALLLVFGFGLIFFGLHVAFRDPLLIEASRLSRLRSALYISGTTIFTLGMGDVVPATQLARLLTVLEAGTGLGFIALVIGYVPVLYTAFSQREVLVALLDARAGSPPTAAELLLRHGFDEGPETLRNLLAEWERWCAELLETHISYPILCYYRSQHDNQSWLAALIAVLDTCALLVTMQDGQKTRQAQLTFAIGRHALVDMVHVLRLEKRERFLRDNGTRRLETATLMQLCGAMEGTGFSPCDDFESRERLAALRQMYEPSACALAEHLELALPRWVDPPDEVHRTDVWSVVAGLRSPQLLAERLTAHVSSRSTAVHLQSHESEDEQ